MRNCSQTCDANTTCGHNRDSCCSPTDLFQLQMDVWEPLNQTDIITLWCWFTDVQMTQYTASMTCALEFWGKYNNMVAMPPGLVNGTPGLRAEREGWQLVVWLDRQKTVVSAGDYPGYINLPLSLGGDLPGQINSEWYPFVLLPFQLSYIVFWSADNGTTAVDDVPVPLSLQVDFDFIPMYQTSATCQRNQNVLQWSMVNGTIRINSMFSVVVVPVFNVVTWALATATFSMSVIWAGSGITKHPPRHMDAPYDLLSFSGALLFALPSMRELLPAMPNGGIWYDFTNIHAQLWLISAGILAQIVRMMYDYLFF